MNKDSLGDRMKGYEDISRIYLTRRMPVILRVDGKAFHSFTKKFVKPYDSVLRATMQRTAQAVAKEIGSKFAYTQSDEISFLLTDYETISTQPWFGKNLQKMVSIAASYTTAYFNKFFVEEVEKAKVAGGCTQELADTYKAASKKMAIFDARAFILPKEEVCNYFIWRQQDAVRNSIQLLGHSLFSEKELFKKTCNDIQDMAHELRGINWNDFSVPEKRGTCIAAKTITVVLDTAMDVDMERTVLEIDYNIPTFTQDRGYVEKYVYVEQSE